VKGAVKKVVEKPKRDVAPKLQKGGKVVKPALQKALRVQKKVSLCACLGLCAFTRYIVHRMMSKCVGISLKHV